MFWEKDENKELVRRRCIFTLGEPVPTNNIPNVHANVSGYSALHLDRAYLAPLRGGRASTLAKHTTRPPKRDGEVEPDVAWL